jgi:fructoselysine transporter
MPSAEKQHMELERGLGLKEATALNMIDMVGIGPFIVAPLVIKTMGGPQAIVAWVAGALLAVIDGFVWSELGAAMPKAGGSYSYLREAYGPGRWGKFMSFLFIWQTMFQAPLVIASGAIGFSQYLTYLVPLGEIGQKAVSGLLVAVLVALLYRRITAIGKLSLLLWSGVIVTVLWLIWGGLSHFDSRIAFDYPSHAWDLSPFFFVLLGQATVQTTYTYLGYYNVCYLGGEVREPEKNIPRSIFISIFGIGILYLAMQFSIMGVLPWKEAANSQFIVSTFVEHIFGSKAADVATITILWIAFASLFSALLGYSRVPYAAAVDGTFFSPFAKLHPQKHFPHISLLAVGGAALIFSLIFRLTDAIKALLAMRILVQFMGQTVGGFLLRKRWPAEKFPFKMWLYPAPAILALIFWGFVFLSTGETFVLGASLTLAVGAAVFFLRAKIIGDWPFQSSAGI